MASKRLEVIINGDPKGAIAAFGATDAAAGTWKDKLGAVASAVPLIFAAAAVGVGVALFKIGEEFDDAYDKIRTGTGATGDVLEGLKDDFRAVVQDVPASFTDAADALSNLNQKLKLTGEPLQIVATQLLELSRMTGTDLKGNVDAVASAFQNFGVPAVDQSGKLDLLFRASQATGISVADLATEMSGSGLVLRSLGLDFDRTAAFLGSLGLAGIDAADVMPALTRSLATAAREGKAASTVFSDAFAAIALASDSWTADGIAMDVFGAKAGPKFAAAIREGKLSYDGLLTTIQGGGETILGAGKETQDFQEKLDILKNRAFVALEPIATRVFELVGQGMDFIGQNTYVIWIAAAAFAALGVAMVLSNPITAIIAAVSLVVGAFLWVYHNVGLFRAAVDAYWHALSTGAVWVWETVLKPIFDAIVGLVRDSLIPAWFLFKGVVEEVWPKIVAATSQAWETVIKPIFTAIAEFINNVVILAYSTLYAAVQIAWDVIQNVSKFAWDNVLQPIFTAIAGVINKTVIPAFEFLAPIVGDVFGKIGGAISWAWENVIKPAFYGMQVVISELKDAFGTIADVVRTVFGNIAGPIRAALDAVKAAWNNTVGGKGIKIDGFGPFPGVDVTIPRLHTGGTFRAPTPGGEGLAMLLDGERVLSPSQSASSNSSSPTFNIYQQPGESSDGLVDRLLREIKSRGPLPEWATEATV